MITCVFVVLYSIIGELLHGIYCSTLTPLSMIYCTSNCQCCSEENDDSDNDTAARAAMDESLAAAIRFQVRWIICVFPFSS